MPESKQCEDDEQSAHQVEVRSFELSRYEVTQEVWVAVMGGEPERISGPSSVSG